MSYNKNAQYNLVDVVTKTQSLSLMLLSTIWLINNLDLITGEGAGPSCHVSNDDICQKELFNETLPCHQRHTYTLTCRPSMHSVLF